MRIVKFCFYLLALVAFVSCKDQEAQPSMNGTFVGPVSIKNATGITTYSDVEVSLKQLSTTSVEVSSRTIDPFVIANVKQSGAGMFYAGDGNDVFRYSGDATNKTLLIDWTTTVDGEDQTIQFGGSKKK
jgi:hypothetical protein